MTRPPDARELRDLAIAVPPARHLLTGRPLGLQGCERWVLDYWRREAPVPAKPAHRRRYTP